MGSDPENLTAAQSQLSALQRDLECPQCQYNLRGLYGDVVHCPECGLRCDIPKLIAAQWRGPWYRVPGLSRLNWPLAWLLFGLMIFIALWLVLYWYDATAITIDRVLVLIKWIGVPIWIVGWLCLLNYCRCWFRSWWGVWLSLLGHGVYLGYVVAVIGLGIMCPMVVFAYFSRDMFWITRGIPLSILFLVLLVLCRRAERFMAEQCIRQRLRREMTP